VGTPLRLLVIVPDALSELLEKGELQPRYYNPGDFFKEVWIMTTSTDSGSSQELQRAVGNARLKVVSCPADLALVNDWLKPRRLRRLRKWVKQGMNVIKNIDPDLIRCHGGDWNTYLAASAKQELGIPYTVSLHINPDENPTRRFKGEGLSREQRRVNRFYEEIETVGLRNADLVMPVYKPIVPYLLRKGVSRWDVHYNVLDGESLMRKSTYASSRPTKLVCVTRMIPEKTPVPILEAIAELPDTELTLIGDGAISPEVHDAINQLGIANRVTWHKAMKNRDLCAQLHKYDIYVLYSQYWELSKSLIEALLTGMPVIVNRRHGAQVPELQDGNFVEFCAGDPKSYRTSIEKLSKNDGARESLGRSALSWAMRNVSPSATEAKFVRTYVEVLREADTAFR
jgi:glycosyltransferase involved in cell wall biosynthesis